MPPPPRRAFLAGSAAFAAGGLASPAILRAAAPVRLRYLTSWFAQAEHGGYYQALATGLYAQGGLDVSIDMGGPQVNGLQLLTGGDADIAMGYDIQVLNAVARGLPVVAVGTTFQSDLQGLMTHPDVSSLAGLKDHRILIASTARTTFWPWLQQRFGFSDSQAAPYTFNLEPFMIDPDAAVQGYGTSEPFEAGLRGVKTNFFPFSDSGYPPYGNPNITTRDFAARQPDAVRRFLRASMRGWRDYLQNPAPGNALIKRANPKMTDDRLAFAIGRIKALNLLGSGDAATMGLGVITEARWKRTYDFLVASNLVSAAVDWRSAFTTTFADGLGVMPA